MTPDQVISALEATLERARAGDIASVAIAAVDMDGAGVITVPSGRATLALLGAVNVLALHLATAASSEG